jgi:DNA-binding IclR family transcriptional regulator
VVGSRVSHRRFAEGLKQVSQTVSRAISVIGLIADEARSIGEVAEHLQVHKSTALRLLQTLEQSGFARRQEDGLWTVGVRLIGIAQQALDSIDIRAVARAHLQRLSGRAGHTVHLGQLIGDEVVYVDKVEGRGQVRMYSRIGISASMHASGLAKAIVAFLDEPLLSEVLGRIDFQRYTANTIAPLSAFRSELAAIAERGWASDNGEFEEFINCIAAPIHGSDGKVSAALSVTAPKMVAPLDELEVFVPDLLAATRDISRDLGWDGGSE